MAMLDRFKVVMGFKAAKPAAVVPAKNKTEFERFVASAFMGSGDPPKREAKEFLEAYATMPLLRGPVERIARAMAGVKWKVKAIKSKPGDPFAKGKFALRKDIALAGLVERRKALAAMESDLEEFEDHPLITLLTDPSPLMSPSDFHFLWQAYLEVTGNAFLQVEGKGKPEHLNIIPPTWITRTPTDQDPTWSYTFRGKSRDAVPEAEVLWDRVRSLANPYGLGSGIMSTLADELDAAENASQMINRAFYNRLRPDMLIQLAGMSRQDLEEYVRDWKQDQGGIENYGKTRFVNVETKAVKLGTDFMHAQFIDLIERLHRTIRQLPGIPPEIMGDVENSNRATIDAAADFFNLFVVVPRIEARREFLQTALAPLMDERIILEYESPVQQDREFALKAVPALSVPIKVDEARALAGLEKIGGKVGEAWMLSGQPKVVEDIEELLKKPEPPPTPAMPFGAPPQPGKPPEETAVPDEENTDTPKDEKPPTDEKPPDEKEKPTFPFKKVAGLELDELSPDAVRLSGVWLSQHPDLRPEADYMRRCLRHLSGASIEGDGFGPWSQKDAFMVDIYLGSGAELFGIPKRS
jgi:phage portal protein BeeE